ncbi:MAG: hypothetical protein ACM33T_17925 [Solirubrobacterales bacterium]
MKQMLTLARLAVVVFGLSIALAVPAHAYLDPVTGSFLIQGLIGGVAALLAGFRSVRERVFGFFRRGNADQTNENNK